MSLTPSAPVGFHRSPGNIVHCLQHKAPGSHYKPPRWLSSQTEASIHCNRLFNNNVSLTKMVHKNLIHFRWMNGKSTVINHSLNQLFGVHRDEAHWQWCHLDDLIMIHIATEEWLLIWHKAWNVSLLDLFSIQCEDPETANSKMISLCVQQMACTAITHLTSSSPCLPNKCKNQCVVKLARRCYPQSPHPLDARKVYGCMLLNTNSVTDYPERTLLICTYNMVIYQPQKSKPQPDTL